MYCVMSSISSSQSITITSGGYLGYNVADGWPIIWGKLSDNVNPGLTNLKHTPVSPSVIIMVSDPNKKDNSVILTVNTKSIPVTWDLEKNNGLVVESVHFQDSKSHPKVDLTEMSDGKSSKSTQKFVIHKVSMKISEPINWNRLNEHQVIPLKPLWADENQSSTGKVTIRVVEKENTKSERHIVMDSFTMETSIFVDN